MSNNWKSDLGKLSKTIRNRLGKGWSIHPCRGIFVDSPHVRYDIEVISPEGKYGLKVTVTDDLLNKPLRFNTIARMMKASFDNAYSTE